MKEIIKIAYGPSSENYDAHFSFRNEDYRLKRLGVDANVELALAHPTLGPGFRDYLKSLSL